MLRTLLLAMALQVSTAYSMHPNLCAIRLFEFQNPFDSDTLLAFSPGAADELAVLRDGILYRWENNWREYGVTGEGRPAALRLISAVSLGAASFIKPFAYSSTFPEYPTDSDRFLAELTGEVYFALARSSVLRTIESVPGLSKTTAEVDLKKEYGEDLMVSAIAYSVKDRRVFAGLTLPQAGEGQRDVALVSFRIQGEELVKEREIWRGKEYGMIRALELSRDGSQVIMAGSGHLGVRVFSCESEAKYGLPTLPRTEQTIWKTPAQPQSVVYAPDGSTIVTLYEDGRFVVYDAKDGGELRVFAPAPGKGDPNLYKHSAIRFSPSGKFFGAVTNDRVVRIWNTIGWTIQAQFQDSAPHYGSHYLEAESRFPTALAFSPDESKVATVFGKDLFVFDGWAGP